MQMCIATIAVEEKCPVCGRTFCVTGPEWGWMYRDRKVCSYHCMRKLEREEDEKNKPVKVIDYGSYRRPQNNVKLTEAEEREIVRLYYEEKWSISRIANKVRRADATVSRVLTRRMGRKPPKRTPRREEEARRRAEIAVQMRKDGKSVEEICKELAISPSTVSKYTSEKWQAKM